MLENSLPVDNFCFGKYNIFGENFELAFQACRVVPSTLSGFYPYTWWAQLEPRSRAQ